MTMTLEPLTTDAADPTTPFWMQSAPTADMLVAEGVDPVLAAHLAGDTAPTADHPEITVTDMATDLQLTFHLPPIVALFNAFMMGTRKDYLWWNYGRRVMQDPSVATIITGHHFLFCDTWAARKPATT
jgi:hypothetical protein